MVLDAVRSEQAIEVNGAPATALMLKARAPATAAQRA